MMPLAWSMLLEPPAGRIRGIGALFCHISRLTATAFPLSRLKIGRRFAHHQIVDYHRCCPYDYGE
jgi:hypothetical protein